MVWKITAEELLAQYAAGERNFAGVDLGGSYHEGIHPKLSAADLEGIDLSGANLENCLLCRANLTEARLFGACLSHSIINGTNFTGADLRYATIDWCSGRNANFTNANMQGVDLSASNFSGSIWQSNEMSGAIFIRTNLRDAQGWGSLHYNALYWETTFPDGSVIEGPKRQHC